MENTKNVRLVKIDPNKMGLSADSQRILRGRMEDVEASDPAPVHVKQEWSVPLLIETR